MAVMIGNMDSGSRSGSFTDPYEDSNPEAEDALKVARFYFFDVDGNASNVKSGKNFNYYEVKTFIREGQTLDNIDQKYEAILVINTEKGDLLPVQMAVVANYDQFDLGTDALSLTELQAKVAACPATSTRIAATGTGDGLTLTGNGLAMASSVYANSSSQTQITVNVKNHIKNLQSDAESDPVDIYLERVNAKVRVKVSTIASEVSLASGKVYDSGSTLTTAQQTALGAYDNKIYIRIDGWYVTAEMPKSYLVKNITPTWTEAALFSNWNDISRKRCYWAINPEDGGSTPFKLGYKNYTDGETIGSSVYTQENAADVASTGEKNSGRNSQVLVKATIGYLKTDGTQKFMPLDYAEYAGQKFINQSSTLAEAVLSYMSLDASGLNIYTEDPSGPKVVGSTHYRQIQASDIEFKTASGSVEGTIQDPNTIVNRYECYAKLNTTANALTWVSIEGDVATTLNNETQINARLDDAPAMIYKNGTTYYYFDIKHLGTSYGIVRNHIYDCNINAVSGLGTPVFIPGEVIIPEPVSHTYSYIAARINVLSWRVVSNDYSLGS